MGFNSGFKGLTFMGPCIVRIFKYISNKMQRYIVYFIWKLLYVIRVVLPPIFRSAYNCIYSIWYLSHRYCYLSLWRQVAVTVWQIPDAVDTAFCAPGDGWWFHPKHVEQFPDKINRVTLHLVGHILEYTTPVRTTVFLKMNPCFRNMQKIS